MAYGLTICHPRVTVCGAEELTLGKMIRYKNCASGEDQHHVLRIERKMVIKGHRELCGRNAAVDRATGPPNLKFRNDFRNSGVQKFESEYRSLQISGDWRIHYVASSNTEKTSETGPLNVYLHNIQFNEEGDSVVFHNFLKADGVCIESSFTGRKIGNNVYTLDNAGANQIHFILVSDDGLIISIENVDEAGNRTRHIGLVGKEAEADDHDLERFKEEVRKLGIPEENIVDFTKVVKVNIEEESLAIFNELIDKKKIEEKNIINFIESGLSSLYPRDFNNLREMSFCPHQPANLKVSTTVRRVMDISDKWDTLGNYEKCTTGLSSLWTARDQNDFSENGELCTLLSLTEKTKEKGLFRDFCHKACEVVFDEQGTIDFSICNESNGNRETKPVTGKKNRMAFMLLTVSLSVSLNRVCFGGNLGTTSLDNTTPLNSTFTNNQTYEGTKEFKVTYASDTVLVPCVPEWMKMGRDTMSCHISCLRDRGVYVQRVKVNDTEEEALEIFNKLKSEKGIKDENVVNFFEIDDCPPCGRQGPKEGHFLKSMFGFLVATLKSTLLKYIYVLNENQEVIHITGAKQDDGTYVVDLVNGEWVEKHVRGTKKAGNTYTVELQFTTAVQTDISRVHYESVHHCHSLLKDNLKISSSIQVKVNDIEAETLKKFNELVKEKKIEDKNILKIIETDECPPCAKLRSSKQAEWKGACAPLSDLHREEVEDAMGQDRINQYSDSTSTSATELKD
ncbi:hypothetical protein E5288_WYG019736 [Bos mutus]|uniref:Lipocalin/cytosolic fatty-acid binding domain-containing protein n=1 Tax=Bos mutus TaxID=72004 RepID=A0A6B0S9R6_9CETA|nr:hypothetical protein [Bos mutus]